LNVPQNQAVTSSNQLLANVPHKERQHFIAACKPVHLVFGDILSTPEDPIQHVFFPNDSVISLVKAVDGDGGLEVGLIGNEGMLGITLMLGVETSPFRAQVLGAGSGLRIASPAFIDELDKCPTLQRKLKRYLYVSLGQLMQSAACNRFHLVEERLARLLLMIRDRSRTAEFYITQELLAQMLGVRRVGVTKAAGILRNKRLISYSRGEVRIQDSAGLEAESCECYRADKEAYDNILHF
jgi:CRP-like cAMP-binding protein